MARVSERESIAESKMVSPQFASKLRRLIYPQLSVRRDGSKVDLLPTMSSLLSLQPLPQQALCLPTFFSRRFHTPFTTTTTGSGRSEEAGNDGCTLLLRPLPTLFRPQYSPKPSFSTPLFGYCSEKSFTTSACKDEDAAGGGDEEACKDKAAAGGGYEEATGGFEDSGKEGAGEAGAEERKDVVKIQKYLVLKNPKALVIRTREGSYVNEVEERSNSSSADEPDPLDYLEVHVDKLVKGVRIGHDEKEGVVNGGGKGSYVKDILLAIIGGGGFTTGLRNTKLWKKISEVFFGKDKTEEDKKKRKAPPATKTPSPPTKTSSWNFCPLDYIWGDEEVDEEKGESGAGAEEKEMKAKGGRK